MQFKEDTIVLTSSGQKVGRIERVVLDPKTNELTHLVVKKGFLFTTDKVVPLDYVDSATEERVVLRKGHQDPDDFQDFEETHYVHVKEESMEKKHSSGGLNPLAYYYPMPGGAWWRTRNFFYPGIPKPSFVRKTEVNIPEGTVALEEGAKVVSTEGENVGEVERVYADAEEQRVTHLLISQGLLSKSRRLIPTMWVDSVHEDIVRLSVSERFVESLPQYTPQD